MARKVADDGPSLFDSIDDQPTVPSECQHTSAWEEVPQARFLSWSKQMQLAYCAERDYDSAEYADDADRQFYQDRADAYFAQLQHLKGNLTR